LRIIARTHPVVLIDVATLNPFAPDAFAKVVDGSSGRRIPAFLRREQPAREVAAHRAFLAAALEHELVTTGSTMIRASSSEAMFARFVSLVSAALSRSTGNQLAAVAHLNTQELMAR
jgi:hypothetical protein